MKRGAKTNDPEVKGVDMLSEGEFGVDFDSKWHQFRFSFAPNGQQSYSGISIQCSLVYPTGSGQESELQLSIVV